MKGVLGGVGGGGGPDPAVVMAAADAETGAAAEARCTSELARAAEERAGSGTAGGGGAPGGGGVAGGAGAAEEPRPGGVRGSPKGGMGSSPKPPHQLRETRLWEASPAPPPARAIARTPPSAQRTLALQ